MSMHHACLITSRGDTLLENVWCNELSLILIEINIFFTFSM